MEDRVAWWVLHCNAFFDYFIQYETLQLCTYVGTSVVYRGQKWNKSTENGFLIFSQSPESLFGSEIA